MNLIADFIDTFRPEIHDENFRTRPRYKTAVIGAYGLDYILKYRHNIQGLDQPNDFTLAVYKIGTMSTSELFDFWSAIARKYAKSHRLRYKTRRGSIEIGAPAVIKILITDREINPATIDTDLGIPVQKEEYYLADLIRRGMGTKLQSLCRTGLERFRPYCDFLATITIERLEKMSPEQREAYFARLFGKHSVKQ